MRRRSGASTVTESCSLSSCLPPLPVRLEWCTGVSWIVLPRLLIFFSVLLSLLRPFLLLASHRRFSARALRLILFLSSSSLPSPSPALLVSLYTVFIIAVWGLWLKICPPRQNPHFHEEVQRVVGVDNQVHGGHAGGWHDVSNIAAGSMPQGADKLCWLNLVCHGACGCNPVARRAHRKWCASL